jgi:hypothetical protein
VVPNYVPKGESVPRRTMLIYRFHHGVGDGYSILKCFLQYLCNDDLEKVVQVKKSEPKRPGAIFKILTTAWLFIRIPYVLVRQCLIDIDSNAWFLPKDKLTGETHIAHTRAISISAIKGICKEYKVSFASVLFGALSGAIGKHFKRKNMGLSEKNIPKVIRLFTPFPWRNHPNNKLINHW